MTTHSFTKPLAFAACLGIAGALLFATGPARAQQATVQPVASYNPLNGDNQSAWSPVTNTWNLAFVGGTPIQRVRSTWAGFDPHTRAMLVQERLNHALSIGPVHSSDITIGQVQGDWCVLFRGQRFLTADPRAAQIDQSSPKELAIKWAHQMRQIIPSLTRPTG